MDGVKIRLFDVHCHLQDRRITSTLKQVIETSLSLGVERLGCNGCCEKDWPQVQALADEYPAILPHFGLHPWWAADRTPDWLNRLRQKLQEVPHAGLGECGLDQSPKCPNISLQEQCNVLKAQLKLGKELQRPISVHCVKAFPELQKLLQQEQPFDAGLILHSWMGPAQMVAPLAAIPGVHFSISGHSLRSDKKAGAMLKEIPLDRLLLETDSPDGLLKQYPDRHQAVPAEVEEATRDNHHSLNHPANIRIILDVVSELRDEDPVHVGQAAFANSERLFPP